ncbi:MAG: hypothetical protein GXO87_14185 [Chlorobi bacterium]|nr:hypothetical protein [Chlorobiota bacterium]
MFLETLDVRGKDFIVYSRNVFDFERNFWIVRKDKKIKNPENISFFSVCDIVKSNIPKSLVVYRLLTNIPNINAHSTKYGFFIKVETEPEVIYFDPIFALKDLNYIAAGVDTSKFRFRIQQLGLTTLNKYGEQSNYTIIYNFDLRAKEAKHQDDKVFADAIFALDEGYSSQMPKSKKRSSLKWSEPEFENTSSSALFDKKSKINEVKTKPKEYFSKVNIGSKSNTDVMREQKLKMLKKALGITINEESVLQDLDNFNEDGNLSAHKKKSSGDFLDLFKKSSTTNFKTPGRKDESVILKLTKS